MHIRAADSSPKIRNGSTHNVYIYIYVVLLCQLSLVRIRPAVPFVAGEALVAAAAVAVIALSPLARAAHAVVVLAALVLAAM